MKIHGLSWKSLSEVLLILFVAACATSPLGRKQLVLVPDSQMNAMGAQAFQQLKSREKVDTQPANQKYINCVVNPLTENAKGQASVDSWEVVVFKNDTANAFALPGGKIGVHTGLLKVAQNDAQLAAVIGHEIGHVIAKHGAERVSQEQGTQLGLAVVGAIAPGTPKMKAMMGLLGVGTQVGILLPFSRVQENEGDLVGLDLMARAGFDPEQSVQLWRNMIADAEGRSPPEWLSTHPASENRIANLQNHMAEAKTQYEQAKAAGRSPRCLR